MPGNVKYNLQPFGFDRAIDIDDHSIIFVKNRGGKGAVESLILLIISDYI